MRMHPSRTPATTRVPPACRLGLGAAEERRRFKRYGGVGEVAGLQTVQPLLTILRTLRVSWVDYLKIDCEGCVSADADRNHRPPAELTDVGSFE